MKLKPLYFCFILTLGYLCLGQPIFAATVTQTAAIEQQLTYENADSLSTDYFEHKNWKALIDLGNKALAAGIDFSVLRIRIGIAYFEETLYRMAIPHLEKARTIDHYNTIVNGYLYYAFLLSGDFEQANRYGHLGPVIDYIGVNAGIKNSSMPSSFGDLKFGEFGLHNRIGKCGSLYETFGGLDQQNYYGTIKQWNYYAECTFALGQSWKLSPAIQLLNYQLTNTPFFVQSENVICEIGAMQLTKRFTKWEFALTGSISNLNDHKQAQEGLILSWYPLGSMALCFRGDATLQQEDAIQVSYLMGGGKAIFQIGKRITTAVGYHWCHALYTVDNNGYLANNAPDKMYYNTNLLLNLKLNSHLGLMALVQYEERWSDPKQMTYQFATCMSGVNFYL